MGRRDLHARRSEAEISRQLRRAFEISEQISVLVAQFMSKELANEVKTCRGAGWTVVQIAEHFREAPGIPSWSPKVNRLVGQIIVEQSARFLGESPTVEPWL
jgi:hypothetical protein